MENVGLILSVLVKGPSWTHFCPDRRRNNLFAYDPFSHRVYRTKKKDDP
jgi:hypothetical protein